MMSIRRIFNEFFLELDHYEKIKALALAGMYGIGIGVYSILRPLKTSIFVSFVGVEYQPWTKLLMLIAIVPIMYVYSKVVDRLKPQYVINFFLIAYGLFSVVFAVLLLHPVYGIANTNIAADRYLGWGFYLFVECYNALILSSIQSFINYVNTPESAKRLYAPVTAGSRVGGALTSGLCALLMLSPLPEHLTIPALVVISGVGLMLAALLVNYLIHKVPAEYLHGYHHNLDAESVKSVKGKSKVGMIEGIRLLVMQPYVFGIFGIVFGTELVLAIMDYQMQVLMAVASNSSTKGMSLLMYTYTLTFQLLGLIFAVFGTGSLLRRVGVRISLVITPLITMLMLLVLMVYRDLITIYVIMAVMRALSYGFNTPVREMLYIPTVKDVQFKSKAWIESFGRSISKVSGSTVNIASQAAASSLISMTSLVGLLVAAFWCVTAVMIGKKYQDTVDRDEVIGA